MEGSDMSSIAESEETCPICLDDLSSPIKSLPTCSHTFCAQCLDDVIRKQGSVDAVTCPACTVSCPLELLELLESPNYTIPTPSIEMDESMQSPSMNGSTSTPVFAEEDSKYCTLCQYKSMSTRAETACITCEDVLLCKKCETAHRKQPHFSHHETKPLVKARISQPTTCVKHGGRGMKFLCKRCNKTICEICSELTHADHDLLNLKEFKREITNAMTPLHGPLTDILILEEELKSVRVAEPQIAAQIISHADALKKQIDKSKDELLSEVTKFYISLNTFEAKATSETIRRVLQRGEDIAQQNITDIKDLKLFKKVKDDFHRVEKQATMSIREMKALYAPTFNQANLDLSCSVGQLVTKSLGLPIGKPRLLDYECRYNIETCYKVDRAVAASCRQGIWLAFLGKSSYKSEYMDTLHVWSSIYGTTRIPVQQAIDIIGLDGRIDLLGKSNGWYSPIKTFDLDYDHRSPRIQISNPKMNDVRVPDVITMTTTKNGNYVLLSKKLYDLHFQIHIVRQEDSVPTIGPLILGSTLASFDLQSLRIHCLKSFDLIIAHDDKGKEIVAFSFEVMQETRKSPFGRPPSQAELQHYLSKKPSILPPLNGYYIMDVCCDDTRVFFALKKREIGAGPAKVFEAKFVDGGWRMKELLLVANRGRDGFVLKENEMVKLGAYEDGRLMCMVYSPTPLDKLKEAAEPAMSVTWYTVSVAR